jgi:peptidoglycan/LPS O-acetylase OafA/YrhL
MPGIFRFVLAGLVAVSHLSAAGFAEHFGDYAVRAFFILSGLAITAVLNDVYKFSPAPFVKNRLLRLFPGYLIVCAATGAAILLFPRETALFHPRWDTASAGAPDLLANLAIVPLAFSQPHFRLFEPGWSTAVEIILYGVLFAIAARSERNARIALAIAVAFHVVAFEAGLPFFYRYFSAASALLGFSIGAATYFMLRRGAIKPDGRLAATLALVWAGNMAAADTLAPAGYSTGVGYYLNTALAAGVIAFMPKPPAFLRQIDKTLGDLSYPIFLCQWIAGFTAAMFLPVPEWRGWMLTAATAPVLLAYACMLAVAQAALVEPARTRIRTSAAGEAEWAPVTESRCAA